MSEPPVSELEIPSLSAVLDPVELRRHLTPLLDRIGADRIGESAQALETRILKAHRGSRCTVDISLLTAAGSRHLIGKVYARDRSDVFLAMQRIERAGFGPERESSIPQPLAFIPALNLVVQEKVDGPLARELFVTGSEQQRIQTATRCALWLASFHAQAPRTGPLLDLQALVASMANWARAIAALGETLADKAARLLDWLQAAAGAAKRTAICAGHGSYSPAQVILAAGRTVAFDWDGFDIADPARDAARFLTALRRLALGRLGSIRALDTSAAAFRSAYLAAGPPDAAANLRFYQVGACLQLAKYNVVHRVPQWREKLEALLDEGLHLSEGC